MNMGFGEEIGLLTAVAHRLDGVQHGLLNMLQVIFILENFLEVRKELLIKQQSVYPSCKRYVFSLRLYCVLKNSTWTELPEKAMGA